MAYDEESMGERPTTKRKFSVAQLKDHWYVACSATELSTKPLSRTILDTPIVLFRDADGRPKALLDRCAHRNVPLSLGRVNAGRLVCGYHGWAYDGGGVCREVPALCGESTGKARRVPSFATRAQDGLVWVFMTADVEPDSAPFSLPHLNDSDYTTVRYTVNVPATLHATLENILDVPHTAFLHRGL
ncbi:MAG: Rieske 2Fe-2S domain-containing protein, partial [Myxococcota bacterium]